MVLTDLNVTKNLMKEGVKDCKDCVKSDVCYFNRSITQMLAADEKYSTFPNPFSPNHLARICKSFVERMVY